MTRLPWLLPLALCLAPAAHAQAAPTSAEIPRTADGHPDLQGAVWATNFFPVFGPNPMSADLVVSEAEAKKIVDTMFAGMAGFLEKSIDPEAAHIMGDTDGLPLVKGERRTRLIVLPADGNIPFTPEAKAVIDAAAKAEEKMDDYEQRPSGERCLTLSGLPPISVLVSYNRLQFIQTPAHLVVHSENGDEARIIPFAADHPAPGPTSPLGDSIARWDGDTLVIETIRNNPAEAVRGLLGKFIVNPDSKVIERYTRLSGDELLYQFTVEDPKAYTAPWLAEFSFYATKTGMYPSPCHEHNLSLPNILMGARAMEKAGR